MKSKLPFTVIGLGHNAAAKTPLIAGPDSAITHADRDFVQAIGSTAG